jgi:hypothetical protein
MRFLRHACVYLQLHRSEEFVVLNRLYAVGVVRASCIATIPGAVPQNGAPIRISLPSASLCCCRRLVPSGVKTFSVPIDSIPAAELFLMVYYEGQWDPYLGLGLCGCLA